MYKKGTINLIDSPYKNPANLISCKRRARLDLEKGIFFDLDIQTDDDDTDLCNEENEKQENMYNGSNRLWNCDTCRSIHISSTEKYWDNRGFLVGDKINKIDFSFRNSEYIVDPLPDSINHEYNEYAFGIYCWQGHNSCAGHKIKFNKNINTYNINWKGMIAFSYSGYETDFIHKFNIDIEEIDFEGIYYPKSINEEELQYYLNLYSTNSENIALIPF